MASTSEIRNGICIHHNHAIYKVIGFQHVKPGKGPAFVRTKIKNVVTGKVIDYTIPSGHKIDVVRVESRTYQFLYREGDTYHFMNTKDFDQMFLDRGKINAPEFLKEGASVDVLFNTRDGECLSCDLPLHIALEVVEAEPGMKGNTANNPTKQVTLETGAVIQVPLFIEAGETIKIDVAKRSYIERVKINKTSL